ncbi:Phenylalanine--tRNA ligase beta subunit [Mycoplasmopsis maculosa]|uniref:Phenylalanine--tRNA ligase beta subunit n=1 Tax=Mycoplasmopsis maculosa TaxID=114885 RepID=A0A449B4F5_9BACT|nr:phenylalanine--tRNA ligase subunit beta [Mycoplasmopsis maculosa]VEU75456.1 Phenylalanine--tRNA ligase beta subunit [Mycoplasmopsis maculosa]
MIISLKQLNRFMPKIALTKEIEKDINNLGYEVETITPFSDVKGIKFAKILSVEKNNNSKNLNIVKLETNTGIITIQTVAKNAKEGYFTVAFVEGSKKGDITFGSKEMAKVVSQGMLSGFSELGFNPSLLPYNEDDIILIKDPKITIDTDPIDYFELDDYIIDITTPANRSDANSYYVLATELAAYYNTEFVWPSVHKITKNDIFKSNIKASKNQAKELTFFEAKINNNVTKLDYLLFLAKHNIEAKGIFAIDLTNMILLLTGTPAHAYDKTKINGKLTCEEYTGEVEILGGKKIEVKNVLAIKDEEKIISLASVMGCENSSVTKESNEILFEIGSFDAKKVRHGAKEIKIDSNSSIQGGKSVNQQMVKNGIEILRYLTFKNNNAISQIINLPKVKKGKSVLQNRRKLAIYANSDFRNLKHFLDTENTMKKIGFVFNKNRIIAPSYRTDIENYEDIIEEYFRFYGYTNFKGIPPLVEPFKINRAEISKQSLMSMGYSEVRTFTLVSEQINLLNPFSFSSNVKLETFVSKEREIIRNSIVTSLSEVVEYNQKRKLNSINIFEYGMINNNVFVYGIASNVKSFDQIKLDIANFLRRDDIKFVPLTDNEYIHPNVSAKILLNDIFIGWIGKIHPKYKNMDVYFAEFIKVDQKESKLFEQYINEPLKSIDLTFEINKNDWIGSKIFEIKAISDFYEIKQIDDYNKGLTRSVTLRIFGTDEQIGNINNHFNN